MAGNVATRRGTVSVIDFLLVTVALAGCGALPGLPTTPPPADGAAQPRPNLGPVDRALEDTDLFSILRGVEGGAACRDGGTLPGSHGGGGRFHTIRDFVCVRVDDDRTVFFLFTDALAAALEPTGATLPGSGGTWNDTRNPLTMDWDVRGDAYVGTARVLAVNGPGTLMLFVSLDLSVP